jgi:hypothetical protein
MKALWLLILGLIIGIAVGYWFYHKSSAVSTTTIQVQAIGKSFVYVNRGDVLKWVNPQGEPKTATFNFGSPCEDKGPTVSTCKIAGIEGFYKYVCDNCLDPGVRVGSKGGTGVAPVPKPTGDSVGAHGVVNTADPPDPFVYCDPEKGAATAQAVKAHVNDQVQWFPSPEAATNDWQITVHAGVCKEGTTFAPPRRNEPTGICTVLKSDFYDVQAGACRVGHGQAQLTVQ